MRLRGCGREGVLDQGAQKQSEEGRPATDEDREGESISWHLLEVLKPKIPFKRMVFHEITKSAITKALEGGRPLDENLVQAQEGRRIVDRLYGYTLSPTLWKKLSNKKLSAGRVQSVGLRLTVQRERERLMFQQSTYYDAKAQLLAAQKQGFEAKLTAYQGQRLANSKDFDSVTGHYKANDTVLKLSKEQALSIVKELRSEQFTVQDIQRKPFVTRPSIPTRQGIWLTSSMARSTCPRHPATLLQRAPVRRKHMKRSGRPGIPSFNPPRHIWPARSWPCTS